MSWRIIDKARVVQDTGNPCKTGILVDGKVYELGGASSWDDLAGRPFGPKDVTYTLLEDYRYDRNNIEEENEGWTFMYTDRGFKSGDTVTVIFNGVEYVCEAADDGEGTYYASSADLPVVISYFEEEGEGYLNIFAYQETATITIVVDANIIESIDAEYLPAPFAIYSSRIQYISDEVQGYVDNEIFMAFLHAMDNRTTPPKTNIVDHYNGRVFEVVSYSFDGVDAFWPSDDTGAYDKQWHNVMLTYFEPVYGKAAPEPHILYVFATDEAYEAYQAFFNKEPE